LQSSVKRLQAVPPQGANMYYEYYAAQVMFHAGGEVWQVWNLGPDGTGNGGIRDALIAKQQPDGSWEGSPQVGGRLGATSLSLLTLQIYYRYPSLCK
jgi:hypothetical protein